MEIILSPRYVPTVQDVLCLRYRTQHAVTESFEYEHMKFTITDIGGHKNCRYQWLRHIDDATIILFLAPLSDYDEFLEDEQLNEDSQQVCCLI